MKASIASLAALVSTAALAHDSTAPHLHPHDASLFPDHAAMLLAAGLVACGMIAVRILRKG